MTNEVSLHIVRYLIEYLNKNPIISYNKFKDYAIKSFLEGEYDFNIRKNTFANIFYPWRKNSKIFNWNSVFDNNTTLTGDQYLKDVSFSFLYTPDGKHLFWHKHLLWISDFHINRIINSSHLYIDGTFITTKDYYQVLVIMYYDNNSQKKIPGCYILINNKYESGYIKCLNEFKRLITIEDTYKINLKSITVDFEKALINALYAVFPNVKLIGCLFHYVKQIRVKLGKYGLLINEFNNVDFLKDLAKIPFLYNANNKFAEVIKKEYLNIYNNNKDIKNLINNFFNYFNDTWDIFFKNKMLDYNGLKKFQRSNSFIENYNKRIKEKLGKYIIFLFFIIGPFLGYKGFSVIPWPVFLTFIINEENYYKNILLNSDSKFKIKNININKIENANKNENKDSPNNNNYYLEKKFLKYNFYSCRYDSYFFTSLCH